GGVGLAAGLVAAHFDVVRRDVVRGRDHDLVHPVDQPLANGLTGVDVVEVVIVRVRVVAGGHDVGVASIDAAAIPPEHLPDRGLVEHLLDRSVSIGVAHDRPFARDYWMARMASRSSSFGTETASSLVSITTCSMCPSKGLPSGRA